jgi:hypothetical protein
VRDREEEVEEAGEAEEEDNAETLSTQRNAEKKIAAMRRTAAAKPGD